MNASLVQLADTHLDALWHIAMRPDFGERFATVPESQSSFETYMQSARDLIATGKGFVYAIVADGHVVGTTRLVLELWIMNPDRVPPAFMSASAQAGEIGWTWLSPEARGVGINDACKLQLLTLAFEQLGLLRVTFKADARNTRSRRAIEKLGAQLDGVLRAHSCAWDNTLRDTAFYSLLSSEWPAAKLNLEQRIKTQASRGQT